MSNFQEIFIEFLRAFFLVAPFAGALLLGLAVPTTGFFVSRITNSWNPSTRLLWILGSVILGSALSIATSGRILYSQVLLDRNPALAYASSIDGTAAHVSQFFTALALLFSFGEIFRWAIGQSKLAYGLRFYWWSLLAFYLASTIVSNVFGNPQWPALKSLYFPFVAFAVLLVSTHVDEKFWRGLRLLLLVPTLGSLIAFAVAPKFAALPDYQSIVPGISQRLYGLADHANSLGVIALTALFVELRLGKSSLVSWILVLIDLTVLFLSQSKTAWAVAAILAVFEIVARYPARPDAAARLARSLKMLIFLFFAAAVLSVLAYKALLSDRFLAGMSDAGVYTLTGRSEIWRATLDEFYNNPMTGYGPGLWDMDFRIKRGLLAAGQAHNQFIQTIGQAGILGVVSLAFYIVSGIGAVRSGSNAYKTLAAMLGVSLLLRCLTESPLRMVGIMDWEDVGHLLFICFLAASLPMAKKLNGRSPTALASI
jgi:O-antigen ligase